MLNQVNLIGRLGQDPESKTLESGSIICNFSLATSKKYLNKAGEKVETTEWHRIVIFGKLAELATQYVKKGSLVFISGEIRYRNYDNKDGQKVYITEIFADQMRFLDAKKEGEPNQNAKYEAQENTPHNPEPNGSDDLPF